MTSTAGVTYTYDGDGKRVMKSSGTLYWYGTNSGPLMETALNGTANHVYYFFNGQIINRREFQHGGNVVDTYVLDHLGSTSIVSGYSGAWDQSTYYPFGGERVYAGNVGNHYKFTGKERDPESGLDNFGARFYSSSVGRFTSTDPIWVKADRILDPQRLNLYSYVRNNPLLFVDPSGMNLTLGACASMPLTWCFRQLQNGLASKDRGHVHLIEGDGKNGFEKGQHGVTVDADVKSDSKNFQTLQSLASDHSATARIDVLQKGDTYSILLLTPTKGAMKPSGSYSGPFDDNFEGYTLFPFLGTYQQGVVYSPDSDSVALINGDSSPSEVSGSMHHELRHIFLGDFGRTALKALHSADFNKTQKPTNNADKQTLDAEKEAIENAKQP